MILMLSGGFNHVVVTASRWIFLNDSYGLSSRYGAQFMVGVIGILLTLAICVKENSASKTKGRGDGVSVSVHDESEPKREASDALKETSFMRCGKKSSDGCIVSNKKSNIVSAAELVLSVVIALMFFFGNRYTTHLEIGIAPYREENYERMQQAVLNYREYEPEELADILEWGKSTDTLIKAMEILEENKLNVFSYMEPAPAPAKGED